MAKIGMSSGHLSSDETAQNYLIALAKQIAADRGQIEVSAVISKPPSSRIPSPVSNLAVPVIPPPAKIPVEFRSDTIPPKSLRNEIARRYSVGTHREPIYGSGKALVDRQEHDPESGRYCIISQKDD